MVADARRRSLRILIAGALFAAAMTMWMSHVLFERRFDPNSLHCGIYYGSVCLNELAGEKPYSWLRECYLPGTHTSPESQAYFRRLVEHARSYHEPPALLCSIWTEATDESSYRCGWPFETYQSVAVVVVAVSAPGPRYEERQFYVDADGSPCSTDYAAMAANSVIHFVGWFFFLWLHPRVIGSVRRRGASIRPPSV